MRLGPARRLVGRIAPRSLFATAFRLDPQGAFPALRSRHLGLTTAEPGTLTAGLLENFAEAFEKRVSVDAVMTAAAGAVSKGLRGAVPVRAEHPSLDVPSSGDRSNERTRTRIGVARDEAFHFYYPDNLGALEAAGESWSISLRSGTKGCRKDWTACTSAAGTRRNTRLCSRRTGP